MNLSINRVYKRRLKYDLINKFNYIAVQKLPKFEKINLSFNLKKSDFNLLVSSLVALELVTNQKGCLVRSKSFNERLKIIKGYPVGSKVNLRKEKIFFFFLKIIKNMSVLKVGVNMNKNVSFQIKNLMLLKELEINYHFFRRLPPLNIVINTTSSSKEELIFMLKFYKFKSGL